MFGIGPWSEGPFRGEILFFVDDFVEDCESGIAHRYFVDVGEAEGDGEVAFCEFFFNLVYFAADVSAGPAYEGEEVRFDFIGQYFYVFVFHDGIISWLLIIFY